MRNLNTSLKRDIIKEFENLAKWGRSFAKRKKITLKKVLEDD